jgi:hypothetical protein
MCRAALCAQELLLSCEETGAYLLITHAEFLNSSNSARSHSLYYVIDSGKPGVGRRQGISDAQQVKFSPTVWCVAGKETFRVLDITLEQLTDCMVLRHLTCLLVQVARLNWH